MLLSKKEGEIINMSELEILEQELHEREPELLIQFVAEEAEYETIPKTPSEKIASALMRITGLLARVRGGWSCGTHARAVRTELTNDIHAHYSDDQLDRFVDLCVGSYNSDDALLLADWDLLNELLERHPDPVVHPPMSWWREMLKSDNGYVAESARNRLSKYEYELLRRDNDYENPFR